MSSKQEKTEAFGRLLDVLNVLREECPWDRKQTEHSLRPNTIEEVFELSDAIIKRGCRPSLRISEFGAHAPWTVPIRISCKATG